MCEGSQPYLRAASRNAPLWRVKPNSLSGRGVSQLEAPFSEAKSTALRSCHQAFASGRKHQKAQHGRFWLWMAFLMDDCLAQVSWGYIYVGVCDTIRSLNGSGMRSELECSRSEDLVGLKRPIPPNLAGSARRSRSRSPGGALPDRVGSNSVLIMGCRRRLMWGIVRAR